jgi:hypothetical protein
MKKALLVLILCFVSFSTVYATADDPVALSQDEKVVRCQFSDLNVTELSFELPDFEQTSEYEKNVQYTRIALPSESALILEGYPDLPVISRLIAIPSQGSVTYEIENIYEEVISNVEIYPYQGEDRTVDNFLMNEKVYRGNDPFPSDIITVSEPQILRDLRLVRVTIQPFQYFPESKELRIIKNADIRVTTSGNDGMNEKSSQRKISRAFEPIYRSMVLNYDELFRDVEYQEPSYLFIYPTDNTVLTYLTLITDWKHQKGFHVETTDLAHTGSSSSQIKTFIQNAYNTWAYPPEFVCLVGDADGSYSIPTSYYSGEGDQYYALLEGGDILADVIIGRLSFNSILEFQTIISKILNYEKTPYMANTDWYKKALLVGDASTSGPSCISTCKFVKEVMKAYSNGYVFDEVYSSPFVSGIANSINNGVSYFHYRGYYGMSQWDNTDISNLSNGYLLPFAVFPTCGTGDFQGTTGRSEYFLKVGSPSAPKGAIAAIGTATLSTHTCFNNTVSAGVFNGVFRDHIFNPGGALVRAKLSLYNSYPTNPNNWIEKFSYWNNLMGDPGMELWTGVPIELNVTHPSAVPVGTNNIEVIVKNTYGFVIEDAWVTIYQEGDNIFESGYSDSYGKVVLPMNTSILDDVTITVTKHNHIPYISEFDIAQANSYASVSQIVIDDDDNGSSSGNNNTLVNPGEDVELIISLKNHGTYDLHSVTATIETNTPGITITDNTEDYGTINANQTVLCVDDFDFSVDADVLGGTEILFDLTITDSASDEWTERITVPIYGPNLDFVECTIIDGNDGILSPGETAQAIVTLRNSGSVAAYSIDGTLHSDDDTIIINDSLGYWGVIYVNDIATNNANTFEISADTQVIPGTQFQLPLHLTNTDGYDDVVLITLEVGVVDVGDPLGPDQYGYYCYDDGDTDYSAAPFYSWVEIDPDNGGTGTILDLSDNGDDGDIATFEIPFGFTFYGRFYREITVCTNGWIAPGGSEEFAFMNRPIPESLGPSPMIAAFWDDLKTSSSGNICYKYDSNSHYFVVEWSHSRSDYDNSEETFEVIIYDPTYYPTPTGDSEILVQYKVIHNTNAGYYSGGYINHGEYATIGLEDHTGKVGLQYSFCNQYPTAAKTVSNESAILFTTRGSQILDPPIAGVSPLEFNFEVELGQTGADVLNITNTGESNLIYSMEKDYNTDRDGGGPDSYGYMWSDSNEPGGPNYDWIDISGIGTEVNFSHNDVASGPFDIGFDFDFYGETYDDFIINPNGWIGFGDDWDDYHNYSIPRNDAPKPAIFGFWDDLDPLQGGDVYYYSDGAENLIIWFDHVIHFPGNTNGTYDFQIIITSDNTIKYQYRSVSGTLTSCTVGIQNASGSVGLEVVYNDSYLQNNLAVEFYRVIDWLSVDPISGIVFADDIQVVDIVVDTDDLEYGQNYQCDIYLTTNDPNLSQTVIPVYLTVGNIDQGTVLGNVTLLGGSATFDEVTIDIGSISLHPNGSGYFEIDVPVGSYTFEATCPGYDSYVEDIEVLLDQTTPVNPILEYTEAPEAIWVELSEDFRATVLWNSVSQYTDTRFFQSYTLVRQINASNWIIIQEGLTDTTYTDNLFNQSDGEYKYGVKAVYEFTQSGLVESETVPIFRFIDAQFEFTLSNGQTPNDIHFTLTGLDTIYSQVYNDTTQADGILSYLDVFKTDYHLVAEKSGYETIDETITINDEMNNFEYTLQFVTAVGDEPIPLVSKIEQNYPNPFHVSGLSRGGTKINYHVHKPAHVSVEIFNIKGERVTTLVNESKTPGVFSTKWNGLDDQNKSVSSGIYFYRLMLDNSTVESRKCILIR